MVKCPRCGAINADTEEVCIFCWTELPWEKITENQLQKPIKPQREFYQRAVFPSNVILAVFFTLLLCIPLIITFYSFPSQNSTWRFISIFIFAGLALLIPLPTLSLFFFSEIQSFFITLASRIRHSPRIPGIMIALTIPIWFFPSFVCITVTLGMILFISLFSSIIWVPYSLTTSNEARVYIGIDMMVFGLLGLLFYESFFFGFYLFGIYLYVMFIILILGILFTAIGLDELRKNPPIITQKFRATFVDIRKQRWYQPLQYYYETHKVSETYNRTSLAILFIVGGWMGVHYFYVRRIEGIFLFTIFLSALLFWFTKFTIPFITLGLIAYFWWLNNFYKVLGGIFLDENNHAVYNW